MTKRAANPGAQFIELRACDIVTDDRWHGRNATGSAAVVPEATEPGQEWSDEQLQADIARRGLIEPLRVRKLHDGRWGLVAGARRLAACMRIAPKKKWPCTHHERERDDFIAASTTLAENTHRRPMRQWEIANHLWSMHAARPELAPVELAEACGMSPKLCRELLAVRSRASAELWSIFERHNGRLPNGITWKDFVACCRLPADEQVPAWLALVDKHLASSASPKRAKRGPNRPTRATVQRWIEECGTPRGPYNQGFLAGLKQGLHGKP